MSEDYSKYSWPREQKDEEETISTVLGFNEPFNGVNQNLPHTFPSLKGGSHLTVAWIQILQRPSENRN